MTITLIQKRGLLSVFAIAAGIFAGITFFLTSCNKERVPETNPSSALIKVENGYLVFKDREHFDQVVAQTENLNGDEIIDWVKQFAGSGYRSFGVAFEDAKADLSEIVKSGDQTKLDAFREKWRNKVLIGDEVDLEPMLWMHYYRCVLNEEGVVKIGDEIWKYTNDRSIRVKGDYAALKNAETQPIGTQTEDVFIAPIYHLAVANYDLDNTEGITARGPELTCGNKTNNNNNGSREVKGKVWITIENPIRTGSYPIYFYTLSCRVQHRCESKYKNWIGWHYENSNLTVSGGGSLSGITSPINGAPAFSINQVRFDDDVTYSNYYGTAIYVSNCTCWASNFFDFVPSSVSEFFSTSVTSCTASN